MPTGPGGLDANGVWQYGEDDTEALASDLLNLGMGSVSTVVGGLGAPTILQVVSTTKTDTFATTSTTDVDVTGLSATITPRSTSSKILVLVSAPFSTTTNQINSITLTRGGTPIGGGTIVGSRTSAFKSAYLTSVNTGGMLSGEHLDSPSTTSSITYQVQAKTSAGTMTIGISGGDSNAANHPRTSSTITLMEVAG
tara:strand:+ start:57 stop:644 length:588 start_codon:yes stop_codon:yes gene_type:complete